MKRRVLLAVPILAFVLLAARPSIPYRITDPFPLLQFSQPVFLVAPPDGSNRFFVVEQGGRILWFQNRADETRADVALDFSEHVRKDNLEEGLLSLAFHPRSKTNRKVYLTYSTNDPRKTVVSEFTMNATLTKINPASERPLLEIEHRYGNPNGGMAHFGPDGKLYVSIGDGGGVGDPDDTAQNKAVLLGKILRLDVDVQTSSQPYHVPSDNPFLQDTALKGEIWAIGFRHPRRFSFDQTTGLLWATDEGQNAWEEINLIEKGGNYGWNFREGRHIYKNTDDEITQKLITPIWDYGRKEGQLITGGLVYRGKKLKQLIGHYIYGDFISGKIWALRLIYNQVESNELISKASTVSCFAEDQNGELYFLSYYEGKIHSLEKK